MSDAQRLSTLVHHLPDYAIFMLDPAGIIIEWTEGAQRVKGYAAQEVLGRHFAMFYTPEDQAAGQPAHILAEAARTGRFEAESWRVRKSGERFWANEIATAIRDETGLLVGFTKISRDLTARRQTEEALRASEARLRTAVSIETVGVLFFQLDGPITGTNAAFAAMTGYREDELLAIADWTTLTAPEFRGATQEAAAELDIQGVTAPYEKQLTRKDGSRFWGMFAPTRLAVTGHSTECVEFIIDITARKQAEAALAESEERYRLIVEQATDYAIFTADADRYIETWPPGAEAVYGWTVQEAVGELIDITYTPADRAAGVPEQEAAQARQEGQAPNVRWHQHKDGSQVFIDGMTYPRLDEDGIFKVGQDVTTRLLAEDARRADEAQMREHLEAEVATATLDLRALSRRLLLVQEEERRKLALELHDEIGQALTGLNFQLAAVQGENGAQALADAQRTVQHLTDQVRQMALALRPEVLDRYGLLAALQWHSERFQAQTGIIVHLQQQGLDQRFSPELEIAAFRVVQEALTNVARHSGVNFAMVHAHGDADLTLVIRDGGRGFDLTKTADTSGLDGMRERVELLGGRFTIESTPGTGTTVIAELPADRQ